MMTVLNVVHAVVFVLPLPSKGSNTPKHSPSVVYILCRLSPVMLPMRNIQALARGNANTPQYCLCGMGMFLESGGVGGSLDKSVEGGTLAQEGTSVSRAFSCFS